MRSARHTNPPHPPPRGGFVIGVEAPQPGPGPPDGSGAAGTETGQVAGVPSGLPFGINRLEAALIAGLVALVLVGAVLAWARNRPVAIELPDPSPTPTLIAPAVDLFVHVVGAVRKPGVYKLPEGSRVAAAVVAAGGFGPRADQQAINLARTISDGEQIVVPRKGEPPPATAPAGSEGSGAGSGARDGKININTADQAALESLPGIGPTLASRIIDHRTANGPFRSVEDLLEVSGIGKKTLENLRPHITV
jgi:competence protein ComEA